MALNNFDEDQFDQENIGGDEYEPAPRRPRGNRTFLIAIGIVGVIFVGLLILLLMFGPDYLAKQRATQQEQAAQINAANTATAMAATALAQQQATLSAPKTPVAAAAGGAAPTKTPVVAIATNTPMGSGGSGLTAAQLATVSALQTQQMATLLGTPVPTSTALPSTGFAEDVGLPMMGGLAIVLVAVIILSRRLRLNAR